jgi:hypothetical protein
MSLDQGIVTLITRRLSTLDDESVLGTRLVGDARRLWRRIDHFIKMGLVTTEVDQAGLELACYALQLPVRQAKGMTAGKLGRTSLRDRCEQAAELMVSLLSDQAEEGLLDNVSKYLLEAPQRMPAVDEARLLADAVNLDDFGIVGLLGQMIQLTLQGQGAAELAEAMQKREEYGYWEARLKESFNFEPIGQIARRRLQQARKVVATLQAELMEEEAEKK